MLADDQALIGIGLPWLEHPIASSVCVIGRQLTAFSHQSRLYRSLERHQLSWRCVDHNILFHHHQLCRPSATPRTTFTTASMVLRQSWSLHQHCGTPVPHSDYLLRILAARYASYSIEHELVKHHVRWHAHLRNVLLFLQSKACVYWTCG